MSSFGGGGVEGDGAGGEGEVGGGGLAFEGGEGQGGTLFGFKLFGLVPLLHEDLSEGFFVGAGGEFGAGCERAEVGVVDDFVHGFGGWI